MIAILAKEILRAAVIAISLGVVLFDAYLWSTS